MSIACKKAWLWPNKADFRPFALPCPGFPNPIPYGGIKRARIRGETENAAEQVMEISAKGRGELDAHLTKPYSGLQDSRQLPRKGPMKIARLTYTLFIIMSLSP